MLRFPLLLAFAIGTEVSVPVIAAAGFGSFARKLRSVTNPLALPEWWISAMWPTSHPFPLVAASVLGPVIWAVLVETLLRRLYDQHPDPDVQ